ncbi:unnamed protein product [Sphagnum troendelagicum]|uniref:CAAX prenyl protease 2/Lysostaphin resistance protein A-like domain-containing protein n=1 Tax=Sphagnum troendelagicum TaxID=128251 RepID=A0ABP0V3W3_9BRYO
MEALLRPQRVWCKYHEEDVRLRNACWKKTPGVVNVAIRVLPKVEVLGFLRNPKRGFCSRSSKGYRDRDWNLGCTAFSRTCARGEFVASECRGLGPRSCWLRSLSGRIWQRGRPTDEKTELGCTAWEKEPQASSNEEIRADALPPSSSPSISSCLCRIYKVDWLHAIFGLSRGEKLWTVPWTGHTIFQVMFLWFAAFWVVGLWIIPIVAQEVGVSKHSLTYRGQALYSLITDIAEGTVGLAILHRCLSRFRPLPGEWFPVTWRGKWYVEACLGCLTFPLVNHLSQINLDLLPFPAPFSATQVEQSIMSKDPIATLLYAVVVSVCAPIWEEVIFRGFLLPSLTRYLPVWGSIFVSSIAFALAHFSIQRMLPLTFLGLVMGIVFVRSQNLLASILLHSLWNGFVFLDLLR